jgi:hypothetical protein
LPVTNIIAINTIMKLLRHLGVSDRVRGLDSSPVSASKRLSFLSVPGNIE